MTITFSILFFKWFFLGYCIWFTKGFWWCSWFITFSLMDLIQQKSSCITTFKSIIWTHARDTWITSRLISIQRICRFHNKHRVSHRPKFHWKWMPSRMFIKVFGRQENSRYHDKHSLIYSHTRVCFKYKYRFSTA